MGKDAAKNKSVETIPAGDFPGNCSGLLYFTFRGLSIDFQDFSLVIGLLHRLCPPGLVNFVPNEGVFPSFCSKKAPAQKGRRLDKGKRTNQRLLNCFRCGKCVLVASVCAFSAGNNNTEPYILQSFRQKFSQLQPESTRRLASFLLLIHGSSGLWRECKG